MIAYSKESYRKKTSMEIRNPKKLIWGVIVWFILLLVVMWRSEAPMSVFLAFVLGMLFVSSLNVYNKAVAAEKAVVHEH